MANNLSAFNSEAWSARLAQRIDQVNIMLPLVNRDWEGDLRQNKTVWIRTPGNLTMGSYTRGSVISYTDLTPVKEAFTVNDGEYFAFEVDDLDKAQSDINAMDTYMKRAVVAMNNTVEAKLLSAHKYTPGANVISAATAGSSGAVTVTVTNGQVTSAAISTAGSGYTYPPVLTVAAPSTDPSAGAAAVLSCTISSGAIATVTVVSGGWGYTSTPTVTVAGGSPITLTSDTSSSTGIYQLFMQARANLSNANVPRDGRWAIVDPNSANVIMEDTNHFIRYGDVGDMVVQEAMIGGEAVKRTAGEAPGFIGRIAGFNVYETPHVPSDADGSKYLLFGDSEAITYAAQITEIEALRLQTTFADAVRGLLLHDVFVPAESTTRLTKIKVASTD